MFLYIKNSQEPPVLSSNDCFIKEPSFSTCPGVDGFDRIFIWSFSGLLVMISNEFPVGNERWSYPCGSVMSHDQPPLPSQQEVLTGLIIRLNEGIQIASQLQNKYVSIAKI